jgi:hypothetical protein
MRRRTEVAGDKGYVTESGRVVRRVQVPADRHLAARGVRWSDDAQGEEIIGRIVYKETRYNRIVYKETRYNLRRAFVSKRWYVRSIVGREILGEGMTRGAAIERALAASDG